jgi:predicted O-methyltransferase YrrM
VARPPESFADVEQRMARVLDGIDGWLQPAEAAVLYRESRLAAERSDSVCLVELGSWQGRSTLAISIGLRDGGGRGALYAIGPHDHSDEGEQSFHALQRNVERAGVSDQVHVVRAIAAEAASDFDAGVVDGLYVDGDHDLAAVRADLGAWQTKLRPGAFVGFNGLFGRGSRRALQQIFLAPASPYRYPRWMVNTMFFEFRPSISVPTTGCSTSPGFRPGSASSPSGPTPMSSSRWRVAFLISPGRCRCDALAPRLTRRATVVSS